MSNFNIDTGGKDSIYQPGPNDPASGAHGIAEIDDTIITDLEATEAGVIDLANRVGAVAWSAALPVKQRQLLQGTNGALVQCKTAGTTGTTEPAWPTTQGSTVTDGTVMWLLLVPGTGAYARLSALGKDQLAVADDTALRTWYAGLANRAYAPCDLYVIGDSITEGEGATARARRYLEMLQARLRGSLQPSGVAGGVGYLPAWSGVTTFTIDAALSVGMSSDSRFGPGRRGVQLAANPATITWSNLSATTIKIAYFSDTGTGSFTYNLDTGAQTGTVNTAAAHSGTQYKTLTMAAGTHTLVISGGSGFVVIEGIFVYNGDESAGVRVTDSGHYGFSTTDFLSTPSGGTATDWLKPVTDLQPAGVIIELGENDASTTGGNLSSATFQTNLQTLINNVVAACNVAPSIVLLAGYQRSGTLVEPWANYVTAMWNLAAANTNVTVVDLSTRMPAVAGDVLGLYSDNLVHPTNKGHAMIADAVYRRLALSV